MYAVIVNRRETVPQWKMATSIFVEKLNAEAESRFLF